MPTVVLPSIVRTFIPLLVGWLISLGVADWLDLTETQVTQAVTALVAFIYYVVIRLLETKFSNSWGWLLGLARQPEGYTPLPSKTNDAGIAGNNVVWLIVGILLIVLLVIWIAPHINV